MRLKGVQEREATHPVDKHVGKRIRQRRKSQKISQTELAAKLGVTFQQVQKYERGANRISASRLWETAHALDTPTAWFFEGFEKAGGNEEPADELVRFLNTTEAFGLGEAYIRLPSDNHRRCLLDLMRSLAEIR